MSVLSRIRLSLHPLVARGLQLVLWGSGATGFSTDIPVVIMGPNTALPDSGPHTASVLQPMPGATYQWTVTLGSGTLITATGPSVTFRTGNEFLSVLTCQAHHPVTGETGTGTHQVRLLAPGPVPPVSIHAPDLAGKGKGPLLAWVDRPVEGLTYLWDMEGGQFLSSPNQDHILFLTGSGPKVTLKCTVPKDNTIASQGTHTITLVDAPPPVVSTMAIQAPARASRGKAGIAASVVHQEDANHSFRWSINEGGHLDEVAGKTVHLTAGHGASLSLRCLATHRDTGDMEVAERAIQLEPALEVPVVAFPGRIFRGQEGVAKVKNRPAHRSTHYAWSCQGVVQEGPDNVEEYRFRAPEAGPATLTCKIVDPETGDEQVWSHAFQVADPAPVTPARILDFRCDPQGPLRADDQTATLTWTLDKDPDRLVLREESTGQQWTTPSPSDRSFPLAGLLKGRTWFTLTTIVKDRDLDRDVLDTRRLEMVVPGVSVLAGDPQTPGSSYMKTFAPGVTPWGSVTGMAWKAPWLYISQGDQHTIRRVHLTGDTVEEVAGMRGIPGTMQEGEDRLFEPGPLVHRDFTSTSGERVEDWVVLQPRANCIQHFREGQVASSMKVLVGENRLKEPSAMAVHPTTGQLFVVDRGSRTIKWFSSDGTKDKTLVTQVEAGGIAVNENGDVFYSDPSHHVIRVLRNQGANLDLDAAFAPTAVFAGTLDQPGAVDGKRTTQARFRQPLGLSMDALEGEYLLVADTGNNLVRKVSADLEEPMKVLTVGGNPHQIKTGTEHVTAHPDGIVAMVHPATREIQMFSPDGQTSHTIPGSQAWSARGLALDRQGNLFFSDPARHAVWVLRLGNPPLGMQPDYGAPELFAGNPASAGKAEGPRTAEARFQRPEGLSLDPKDPDFLLITDAGNQLIWRVPVDLAQDHPVKQAGKHLVVESVSSNAGFEDGPAGLFSQPRHLCGDGHGRIFVQDQTGQGPSPVIRVIDLARVVTTLGGIPGNPKYGREDVPGAGARFKAPTGISVDPAGIIYVADSGNRCVRRIAPDGHVSLVAGSEEIADGQDGDNSNDPKDARFSAMGFLGTDFMGRILLLEPAAGGGRLRNVDLKNGKVTTVKGDLNSDLVCTFPASGREWNQPFVKAERIDEKGNCELKIRTFGKEEIIDPKVTPQALCADRLNRVWVLLAADPAHPGQLRIQRYSTPVPRVSSKWDMEGATLHLPQDVVRSIDGRPHALWTEPRITAMATDSHHNLFLADARNGSIWKVDEQRFSLAAKAQTGVVLDGITLVAGQYPFLGPVGRDLNSPLPSLQGIALTPHDDVLVTCGNAVLQITQQPPQSAPNPWTKTEDLKVWTDPPVKKAPESSSSSSPKPKTLDDRTEQTWQISLKNAEERLAKALKALQALKAETWAAELAFRNDPTSRDLMIDAEMRAKALVKPQHAFDLVQIEMDAKKAAYACLLLERHPVNGRGKADDDHQVLLRLARAESDLKQATFEGLRLTREKEAMRAHDPLLPLIQPQLDQLKVIQAAHANEVEALQKQKEALGVLKVTDPKVAEIERRRQELLMFEKANAEKGISPFLRWSGGAKPT